MWQRRRPTYFANQPVRGIGTGHGFSVEREAFGKRKTLSRKNSVLETSTRTPLHKPSRHNSDKCSSTDLSRPLLSSGSESSTCDACSEILRTSDPLGCDDIYHSAVTKAASTCRIHYRWPSCMSRWGQSSTVTASDVESMDTVSVTLSDYQGAAHSTVSSKGTSHGSSLLCLCDRQGTWPFNHCGKCGRQVYSSSSLGPQNGLSNSRRPISPDQQTNDVNNGFSPQWTMNAALPSPSIEETCSSRKESAYQMMQPGSDRASLCSHTSRSSSTSTASSSGSEYSVPRNYLETLYDKPKALHIKNDSGTSIKNCAFNGSLPMNHKGLTEHCNSNRGQSSLDNTIVCACHEPISDWMISQSDQTSRPQCSCWSQLSLSMRSEKEIHVTVAPNKSATANRSPLSSPKKVQYNTSGSTIRTSTVSIAAVSQSITCTCPKGSANPYTHYAVPRMALSGMYLKDKQLTPGNGTKHLTENPFHSTPSEDYDVPKKFADMRQNRDIALKSGVPCKCSSSSQPVQKSLEAYNNHHGFDPPASDNPIQICTCQRVMLWAGSFVPCLGRSSVTTENGWQRDRMINHPVTHVQNSLIHGAVCCEPHRTSELVLVNGKPKHILHNHHAQNVNNGVDEPISTNCPKEDESAKLPSEFTTTLNEKGGSVNDLSCNYVNIDFPGESSCEKPQVKDDSTINYANLDFSQTVPFYENSNLVLNRLEQNGGSKVPNVKRPPLPPRGYSFKGNSTKLPSTNTSGDSIPSQSHCIHNNNMPNSTAKHINGSAYELMCFEKPTFAALDDDYLMMQPIFPRNSENKISKNTEESESVLSTNVFDKNKLRNNSEEDNNLPLRPFMPLSYQHSETEDSDRWSANGISSSIDTISKKQYLINEEMEIRSSRSNSLSELKKIVLLRKRSSSVDGKSNIPMPNVSIKSNPASPLGSPRSFIQRKNSLFSKLSLKSKEKSMSTNEIIPPAILPTTSNNLINYRRNTLHRSADCLKLNEECVNSDDDSSDLCENSQREIATIKRSSSVPCRPTVPEHLLSPLKTNIVIIPEMNDLNKDTTSKIVKNKSQSGESQNYLQRKYSLGSQEKPKINLFHQAHRTVCDTFKQLSSNEPCDSIAETHAMFPRSVNHTFGENSILDPYKSTSSSSSDTSDFIDSLTRCSRSSSSSSGSTSSDYMRSEDIYNQKPNVKTSVRNFTVTGPSDIPHKTRFRPREDNEYQKCNADLDLNSSKDNFCPSLIGVNHELSKQTCSTQLTKESAPIVISNYTVTDVTKKSINSRRTRCDSKSPTSSTSSLSTSPSMTDYSSSSSTNNCCNVGYVSVKKCASATESYRLSTTSQPQTIPSIAATSNNGYVEHVDKNYELDSGTSSSLTDCNVDVCH